MRAPSALLILTVACSSETAVGRCTPGQVIECPCRSGDRGVQTCTPFGAFGACDCPATGSVDAAGFVDASTDLTVEVAMDVTDASPGLHAPRCVPGASQACACFDARTGAQVCRPDGTFDPCLCVGAITDGGALPASDTMPLSGPPVEVVTGWAHTCARRADGAVFCWGSGNFTATGSAPDQVHLTPQRTVGIEDAVSLAAPTCVLRRDQALLCWACSTCSQEMYVTDPLPRVVAGLPSIRSATPMYGPSASVGAGICYYPTIGAPLCLGYVIRPGVNPFEPRFTSPSSLYLRAPTPLEGVGDIEQVAGVAGATCARSRDGQVLCWGANGDRVGFGYQLGDGLIRHPPECGDPPQDATWYPQNDCSLRPVRVAGVDDAVELHAGGRSRQSYAGLSSGRFCVRHASGYVSCWGTNESGQLGDGTTIDRAAPVHVLGISDAIRLSVSGAVSCALLRAGTVVCWGANDSGQLGDGRASHGASDAGGTVEDYSPTPVSVVGLSHVAQISVGHAHVCALRDDGRLFCWGSNRSGQLGNNSTANSYVPVEVRWP